MKIFLKKRNRSIISVVFLFLFIFAAYHVKRKRMRKKLLVLCVSMGLSAQVITASTARENLPDSVYTYQGKNKTLYSGAAIHYDETGRKILEEGYLNRNGDHLLDENDQAYQIEYTYAETAGRLIVEEMNKQLSQGEWKRYMRIVQVYDIAHPDVPVERYDYSDFNGRWLLFANTIGTEFDEKGLPIVLMDTIFDVYPVMTGMAEVAEVGEVTRFEVTYTSDGMAETLIEYVPNKYSADEEKWALYRKREYVYDGKNLMNDFFYYYTEDDWVYSYAYAYTYDEKNNRTSQIRLDDDFGSEVYYENIYLSGGNSNETIPDFSRKMKIAFTDGQLKVTLEDDASFDVSVYNLRGQLVAQQTGNRYEANPALKNATPGIYTVRVTSGMHVHTQKFFKK